MDIVMKLISKKAAAVACLTLGSMSANAALIGFVSNPTSNSVDWATEVASMGGAVNSNVNFDSMSTGVFDGSFYSGTDGVTFLTSGDVNTVAYGAGPGQSNTSTTPTSSGEGLHAPSNYLQDGASASSFTISFDTSVLAVGFDIIDYYNPYGSNDLTIEAFTGQNALGTSLGSFTSESFNFQKNNEYFMGLLSTDNNIGSLVFSHQSNNMSDVKGLDNIVFATVSPTTVPEPAPLALLSLGLICLGFARRQNKS